MLRHWAKKTGIRIILSLFAVLLLLPQLLGTSQALNNPVICPGQMVDVGGYRLHLYKSGSGSPTVVIDSGLGGISTDWALVQEEIAKFTSVVTYDRAGIAWSDPGPYPRTSQKMIEELHLVLKNANILGPYILVGASFGGNNVQLYTATYPNEVVGLVLVDSSHEDQLSTLPAHPLVDLIPLMQEPSDICFISNYGLDTFVTQKYLDSKLGILPQSMRKIRLAVTSQERHLRTIELESRFLAESLHELANVNRLYTQNIPCFVLTMGRPTDLSEFGIADKTAVEKANCKLVDWQKAWNCLQKDLVTKFSNSRQLIADRSDHAIMWHQPELIIQAVKVLLEMQKNGRKDSI